MIVKYTNKGEITIPIVYVDDIILTWNDDIEIARLKGCFHQNLSGCRPSETPMDPNQRLSDIWKGLQLKRKILASCGEANVSFTPKT